MAMSVIASVTDHSSVKRVKLTWTSAADGTASGVTTEVLNGQILELVTDPGATAPTDNYDITVTDADGLDVLAGQGANRDTANTEYVLHSDSTPLGCVVESALTLNISNAGDSKQGVVYLFLR